MNDGAATTQSPHASSDGQEPRARAKGDHTPRPAAERHARQQEVERLFVARVPSRTIALSVSEKYKVSARIIWSDIAGVKRRMAAEAKKRSAYMFEALLRAAEDLLLRDRQANDRDGERGTLGLLVKICGFGQGTTVNVNTQAAIVAAGMQDLLGPYASWTERIAAEARADVRAALPPLDAPGRTEPDHHKNAEIGPR